MWSSPLTLQAISSWALVVAVIAGLVAVVAGAVGTVASNKASQLLQREANEKIARADESAAQAKLETVRLQSKMAWRRLSKDQRAALLEGLTGAGFSVWTSWVGDDPEATIFRNELDEVLRSAGLQTKYFSGWQMALGLKILGNPSPARDQLIEAFKAADLDFTVEPPGEFAPNDLVILVGSKPESAR